MIFTNEDYYDMACKRIDDYRKQLKLFGGVK